MAKVRKSIETKNGPVFISKHSYFGLWMIWTPCNMPFSEKRFKTRKEAYEYLEKYYIEG